MILIVGGGPAGLATAATLRRLGLRAVVLEQSGVVAAAWRGRYDRMRLNTSRLTSRLPGLRYPPGTGLFPTRDEFVAYLERYVDRHGIDLRLGVRVARIDRDGRGWRLQTAAGDLHAEQVVVATGYERRPFIPPWPGCDRFTGRLLHAADYRSPAPFCGSDVLVVGSGSSGMEIAYDLAAGGAGPVRLSVRTPPSIVLRSMGGLPGDLPAMVLLRLPPRVGDSQLRVLQRLVLGDLAAHGLPVPAEGAFTRLRRLGVAPTVVDRQMVQAIRDRRIQVVSGLQALDATGATLADGTRVEPDVVVAATGYRRGLEGLVGHLGVLDGRGTPGVVGGRAPAPGLRFVGFVPRPGQLHHMGVEARRVARSIARELRRRPAAGRKSITSGRQGPRPKLTARHELGGRCEEQDPDGHGPWPDRARPGWWSRAGGRRAAARGLRSADRMGRPAQAGSRAAPVRAAPVRSAAVRAGRRPPRQRRRDGRRAAAGAGVQADPASASPFPTATPATSSHIQPAEEIRRCATNSSPRSCCGRRKPPVTPRGRLQRARGRVGRAALRPRHHRRVAHPGAGLPAAGPRRARPSRRGRQRPRRRTGRPVRAAAAGAGAGGGGGGRAGHPRAGGRLAESVGREDLIVRAFTAWTEPTPWVSRPYGMVDERTVSVLLRLLLRTDLDPEARCRLLGSLSFELAGEGDPRAAEAAREAIALARDLADPALLALALFAEAWEASWDREPGRRARLAEEIGRIGSEQHLVAYRWCAEHIAATAAAAGNDLRALRGHVERGLELARAYQMPEPLSVGCCAQAMLAHVAGRFDEAERRYAEACAQMARHGSLHADGIDTLATVTIRASQHRMAEYAPAVQELDTRFGPLAADARAVAPAAAGRPDAARAVLDGAPPLRPDFYFSIFATLRAMAVMAVGQREPAEELYAALLPIRGQLAGAASTSLAMRPVAHTLAELARLLGRRAAVPEHLAEAVAVARAWEAPRWEAEAHAAMGPAARPGLTSRASASPGRS